MSDLKGWNKIVLDSVISVIQSGSRPKGGVSSDRGDVPSLGGENIITAGGVSLNEVKLVSFDFFNQMTKGHLQNSDVLINKDGAQTGKVGYYQSSANTRACINEHLFLLRGKSDQIDQKYLYYTLLSQSGQNQIRTQISGSAQPGLKSTFIKGIIADLPQSITEQTKIAEILSTVDRAIEQTEALIAKQQCIKTGLMQDLLTHGIDKHGNLRTEQTHQFKDSPLGRIPVEWVVNSLDQLTTRIVDGVHHTPTYLESGIPFVVITDLTGSSEISFSDTRFVSEKDHREFSKRANPKSGDILVTKDGTLGVARIVPPNAPEFSIFVSVAMLRPKRNICLPELIWAFFESGEFLVQLGALSAGTGLTHIHLEHFRSFLLRRPPVDEQELIFRIVSKKQSLLDTAINGLHKLKKQKSALMQDLLTGKKRVTALLNDTEVATVRT